MNLESKIIQTKYLIKCAVMEFGLNKVIFHTLVGKTQLSFLILPKVCILIFYICLQIQQMNILKHLNTFVGNQKKMEQILLLYFPKIYMEKFGHLKKVVETYGYPMFSKRISNAIRTYRHARSPHTKLTLKNISIEILKNITNIRIFPFQTNVVTS